MRKISLFKDVAEEQIACAQQYRKNQVRIPAHARIFQEGETHEFFYTLYSGWAVLYKTVSNTGKRQILRFILPGDLIGYQTTANGILSYSAGTVTESVLCAFPRSDLKGMLQENPELALQLLKMESRDMSLCQNHLMAAGRKTAKESVAYVLLELYHRVQNQNKNSYAESTHSVEFPITQEDIGDAVGLTNVHVNRVIKEMMSEKLIQCHKKQLSILDEKRLSEIAEFSPDMISGNPLI